MIRLNEIFSSIQGEGPHMGRLATFVRLGGCNMRCEFCDTKYAHTQFIDVDSNALYIAIKRHKNKYVVFTGGEPLFQMPAIKDVVAQLREDGYTLAVETNGSISCALGVWDYIIVSPKDKKDIKQWIGRSDVTFKFVVDATSMEDMLRLVMKNNIEHAYFMPCGITPEEMVEGTYAIVKAMEEVNYDGFVTPRLHILMGMK